MKIIKLIRRILLYIPVKLELIPPDDLKLKVLELTKQNLIYNGNIGICKSFNQVRREMNFDYSMKSFGITYRLAKKKFNACDMPFPGICYWWNINNRNSRINMLDYLIEKARRWV